MGKTVEWSRRGNDGKFFMSLEDWGKSFNALTVCHLAHAAWWLPSLGQSPRPDGADGDRVGQRMSVGRPTSKQVKNSRRLQLKTLSPVVSTSLTLLSLNCAWMCARNFKAC